MNGPIRLRQRGRNQIFFINMLHTVQHVYEKDKKSTMLPQAKNTVIENKRPI
jgi:hypothetical protein